MEHLTFSLWFTLVWWSLCVSVVFIAETQTPEAVKKETMKKKIEQGTISDVFFMVYIPAIAILLEYLIVRR